MRVTRRDFHKGLTGLTLAALVGRPTIAAAATASPDDIFLNRLTFGTNTEARRALSQMGRSVWLEDQLKTAANGPEITARLEEITFWIEYEEGQTEPDNEDEEPKTWQAAAEHRPLKWINAEPEELVGLLDWYAPISYEERERPAHEVRLAAIVRAVHEPAQLAEVMTQFWHDHFNVNSTKDEVTAALFPSFDRALRQHALGNFRDLLRASATAPSMLHYLNNDESEASPANENYARELLELHTLGQGHYFNDLYDSWREVPGALTGVASGYIDDDVYEVARALTGWSIGDGREFGDNNETENNGRMAYIESWHDPYQKRILGVEFEANAAPMADGEKLLEMLAVHPATAQFVTGKILRRLGIEQPSESYSSEITSVFTDAKDKSDQIARVIRAIVTHPEFDATPPTKLRRPFEFLAAIYRTTGAEVSPKSDDMDWILSETGWRQHTVAPPTGHSDHTIDWADTRTISGMINLALEAHSAGNYDSGLTLQRIHDGVTDMAAMAAFWEQRFAIPEGSLSGVISGLDMVGEDLPLDDLEWYEWINTLFVTSASLDASFLYR